MEAERKEGLAGRAGWAVGDTLRFPPLISVWEVQQVVERGLVVELEDIGGHRHLIEWHEAAKAVRPNALDSATTGGKAMSTTKAGSQDALVRRPVCPKCGCRRFRNIGSFGTVGHDNATAVAVYVECMRCEEMWDRKSPNASPSATPNPEECHE